MAAVADCYNTTSIILERRISSEENGFVSPAHFDNSSSPNQNLEKEQKSLINSSISLFNDLVFLLVIT
jgi:hypothetical protein